jgi:hypothetical protein
MERVDSSMNNKCAYRLGMLPTKARYLRNRFLGVVLARLSPCLFSPKLEEAVFSLFQGNCETMRHNLQYTYCAQTDTQGLSFHHDDDTPPVW